MRVLILTHRFFPKHRAGTEVLTLQLAQGLTGRGYEVTVLTGEHDENLPCAAVPRLSVDTYEGLTTYRLHYGKAEQTWRHQGLREKLALSARLLGGDLDPVALHVDAPERVAIVRDLVVRLKPDLVHINHLIGFSAAAVPAIRHLGIPVTFTPTDYFAVCPTDQLLHSFDNQTCQGPGNGIDCIRCMHPMPRWTARLAMQGASTPLMRRSGAIFRSLAGRYPAIVRALNMADRIMPSTRFLADVLTRHGVDQERIRVVPYGIDIGELPAGLEVPTRFDSQSRLHIGFIGKLEAPKGAHVLLRALDYLGSRSRDIHLDIYAPIDPDEPYCRTLMTEAQEYGDSVRFAGTFPPERIGAILRSMHVLVVPSIWYESIPLVLRSSLNAGTPAIVSDMGGLTEPLTGEMRHWSFTAGKPEELSRRIGDLADNPALLHRLRASLSGNTRSISCYLNSVESEYRAVTGLV